MCFKSSRFTSLEFEFITIDLDLVMPIINHLVTYFFSRSRSFSPSLPDCSTRHPVEHIPCSSVLYEPQIGAKEDLAATSL